MGKGAQAKADKAAAQAVKAQKTAQRAEEQEEARWSQGSKGKSKSELAAEKQADAARKKAERDKLLAEEDSAVTRAPPAAKPKAPAKQKAKVEAPGIPDDLPVEYTASGIDDAIDALSLVNERNDKASVGARAALAVDSHPERRFKAAFEAYKDANLSDLRQSHPGLRLQQYHDLLYKDFQKSASNPFNQTSVSYNAGKAEKIAALEREKGAKEARSVTDDERQLHRTLKGQR